MSDFPLLDAINSAEDVKKIQDDRLDAFCSEIRKLVIETVALTGGHLSSNLGIVELTVALYRVFNPFRDRIIFDVGHQCYIHKILSGRKDKFETLRQFGGLSGFPNPSESSADPFIAGHASNSVSVGIGMARAAGITGNNYNTVCVIGDGALTGGMAYEALNDAGQSGLPLIVILNDNDMSIGENVGGLSKLFSQIRCGQKYIDAKKATKNFLSHIPLGKQVESLLRRAKNAFKNMVLPPNAFFESMGFYYLGPADGHDVLKLERLLKTAKSLEKPVVIHVKTVKGKGYEYAEKNPEKFHGIGKFDVKSGKCLADEKETFSKAFGETVCELAEKNSRICAVTAAMTSGVGLKEFQRKFPNRFFDVGIAEEHAVTMSAALAKQECLPVCAVYSTFIQRAVDQIINDTSILKLPVLFAVDRAGITGADGETHNGVFDIALLSCVPNMEIYCPSNTAELKYILKRLAGSISSPVCVRYPKGSNGIYIENNFSENSVVLREGADVTLVSYGIMINQAILAADILQKHGISAEIIKLNRVYPLDTEKILRSYGRTKKLVIIEDIAASGCIGEKIAAKLAFSSDFAGNISLFNAGNGILPCGSVDELYKFCGIDGQSVADKVLEDFEIEGKTKA